MNFTRKSIERLLDKHERLMELASNWSEEKFPKDRHGDMKFEYGRVLEYINTSCHCHPEMCWDDRGSIDEFYEWLKKKNVGTKYYTVKS